MGESIENPVSPAERQRKELVVGIAATLLFFLAVLLVPVVGAFAGILTPLPSLLFFYRLGSPTGYGVAAGSAAAGTILLLVLHAGGGVPFFIVMLSLGILLAQGMRYGWSLERTVGTAVISVFLTGGFLFWLMGGGAEGNLFKLLEDDLRSAVSAALQQYGAASPEIKAMEQGILASIPTVVRLFPGVGFSAVLIASWINVLITRWHCSRRGIPFPQWVEWTLWKAPEVLVWGVIACGFMILMPLPQGKLLGMNGLLALGTIYFFQGLSIAAYWFDRWNLPKLLRGVLYALLLLQQFATLGLMLAGFFDTWGDFRRLTKPPPSGDFDDEDE